MPQALKLEVELQNFRRLQSLSRMGNYCCGSRLLAKSISGRLVGNSCEPGLAVFREETLGFPPLLPRRGGSPDVHELEITGADVLPWLPLNPCFGVLSSSRKLCSAEHQMPPVNLLYSMKDEGNQRERERD